MNKNVLITSIGSFSTDCVVKSLKEIFRGQIIGCDIYPSEWHNTSKHFNLVLKSPMVKEKIAFYNFIREVCYKYSIGFIVPLIDVDIDFFNEQRNYFTSNGIIVTMPSKKSLDIIRNKHKVYEFFKEDNLVKPINTYSIKDISVDINYPLLAKPKYGRSSKGIHVVRSEADLNDNYFSDNYIFQEITQGEICSVDYVRSETTGRDYYISRKELLRTSHGAGMTIQTFKSEKLGQLISYIGKSLDINGCINIEFIEQDKEYYLMDINPRFSAGIGFSKLAGYDFVKSHINCFIGKDILPGIVYPDFIAEKKMIEVINKVI